MKYQTRKKAIILLADGTVFHGKAIGDKDGSATGEICFNTGMTGYQEIFTDPSYYGQLMVTTNAHIGNYGTTKEDNESGKAKIAGLICKNFNYTYSRPAADASLESFLEESGIFGISDVDTRALVTYIRENGAMNAIISTDVDNIEELRKELEEVPDMNGLELASKVSTKEPYYFGSENATYRVAALDIGIKKNILRNLADRDVYVKVFPYNATYEEMNDWNPDGYFLSNGPGDPQPLSEAINLTKKILDQDHPLFGICLGHQVIAIANGIKTYKMHHGHRGINHPVLNLKTKKGEITSQNHGFSVDKAETEAHPDVEITHMCINDDTVGGIALKNKNCFSVQYHPEASPGPHDASYLFDEFLDRIKRAKA
ncbi:MAG TPA: glutamine-hydrolyzing carbamoyl-phosphate synthase small subunit [Salegentibacter sp.]|uniref:glutamine-hydrolyzing carbamoyl-phosphate synthase small subunit n=1 Tax=Salegentibacter sp. TaxID=1903072 RepID=UPI002F955D6F